MKNDETAVKIKGWTDIGASHQSLHGVVTDSLRDAIMQGVFKPGERLTESKLAKLFSVSRNPIREALRALQAEGIIEISPRRGARVREISADEAFEIIELRAELEGINARNAARRCDEAHREELRRLLEMGNRDADAGAIDALKQRNNGFHALLSEIGGNRYLADYVRTLRERTLWLFTTASDERVTETWREHAGILQAVIAQDSELSGLLASRHVRKVGELVLARLQENGPDD